VDLLTFERLVVPAAEVAAALTRWDNDPELVPFIRPSTCPADLARHEEVTLADLRERLRTHEMYLIYLDGRLVGEVQYQVDPPICLRKVPGTAWIGITIGEQEARHSGVGSAAMTFIESELRSRGLKRIELGVFEFNHAARGLYEKLGYKEIGREYAFTYYDGRMWPDIRMEKELRA
jgi:RimJ/RimL family protein N-acetyltransferase